MSTAPSPGDPLFEMAKPYFPDPEFMVDTVLSLSLFSYIVRVRHVPSGLFITQSTDIHYDANIDRTMIENMADRFHQQIATAGHGTPFNNLDPPDNQDWGAIRALLQLMGLELIWRDDVQGVGERLYLVRRNEWAIDISLRILGLPLQYWQMYVQSVLAKPPTPGPKPL